MIELTIKPAPGGYEITDAGNPEMSLGVFRTALQARDAGLDFVQQLNDDFATTTPFRIALDPALCRAGSRASALPW